MKILLITDQHFGARNDNPIFLNKFKQFYEQIVFPYIDRNNIDTVFCLGDTFDKRKSINYLSLEATRDMWFKPLQDRGIKMYMLIGNHDIYFKNTLRVNACEHLLKEYDNLEIITKPTEVTLDERKFLMLPWICDDNKNDIYKAIEDTDATSCMGHLELQGFEALPGVRMQHGDDPERYSKFKLTCTGHFHHRSRMDNIMYLGNPYQLYWNDYGAVRGFHVLNTDDLRLTFIQNPFNIFEKIFYDDTNNDYETLPDHKELVGSYVKLVVQQKDNQKLFDRYVKHLQDVGVADLKIIEDLTLEAVEIDESIKLEDTMTILENYVNELEDHIDKKNIVKIVKSLYLEALNV
tara:strand:- start:7214 stop:8260 length:1047 start_codon:yes stop_codon:yes gene_type:complete